MFNLETRKLKPYKHKEKHICGRVIVFGPTDRDLFNYKGEQTHVAYEDVRYDAKIRLYNYLKKKDEQRRANFNQKRIENALPVDVR